MMFNLDADPNELVNLAADAVYATTLAEMRAHIGNRWYEPDLKQRVINSQKNRLFVQEAMKHGIFPSWDYTLPFDASRT